MPEMKSWYYQTDRGYGQWDATSPEALKRRLLACRLITEPEAEHIEIWEAIPGGRQPSFPKRCQNQKEE